MHDTVRVLYHLNGVTKVAREGAYTPGPSVLDIPTADIPEPLRQIGARFVAEVRAGMLTVRPIHPELVAR